MEAEKTLKEKVFEACNLLQEAGEKITTQKVREYTKGSTRDISRYINKWNEAKKATALKVVGSGEISPSEQELAAISNKSIPSSGANSTITEDDLAQLTLRAAQRSALIKEREEAMVIHYLENPDQLPPDLLAKLEAARKKTWEAYYQRRAELYNPEKLFQKAMDYIKREQRPS